ncbi:YidE/YbjL duplication [Treponema sp.]|uniref:aspartate-alanine antiporter-like transporter n=1 Tax=Treponema sp. TaxID=166 RepID=UPI00298EC3B8|nr:YidE/YbjL duplication [Treponema sp.]MCQ2241949.1 YidE/YbjL duplication [Treponema sp.]
MTAYLAGVVASALSFIFIVFAIGTIGYLLGAIKVKGIELGTAGVLLVALIWGVIINFIPSFQIGERVITIWSDKIKGNFGIVSNIGTALFVTAVGLIAGPKFFRSFNKSTLAYIVLGFVIIIIGGATAAIFAILDPNCSSSMAVGLLTGGLTSTPGFSAGKEVAVALDEAAKLAGQVSTLEADVTAGYGIAYTFGVLGVVLFVQVLPKILKVNMADEVANFQAANQIKIPEPKGQLIQIDPFGFFAFFLAVALGCLIGAIKIPVINFSLGNSGGCLIGGLIVGHFAHFGKVDCRLKKETLNFMRELGLVLFLIGAGVPGGVNFITKFRWTYFIYGAVMTTVPMIVGYILARYIFKLSILNNLGSITGGMTSTPALGTLIATAGTDEVSAAYAATYPFALVSIVLASKIIIMLI